MKYTLLVTGNHQLTHEDAFESAIIIKIDSELGVCEYMKHRWLPPPYRTFPLACLDGLIQTSMGFMKTYQSLYDTARPSL